MRFFKKAMQGNVIPENVSVLETAMLGAMWRIFIRLPVFD